MVWGATHKGRVPAASVPQRARLLGAVPHRPGELEEKACRRLQDYLNPTACTMVAFSRRAQLRIWGSRVRMWGLEFQFRATC